MTYGKIIKTFFVFVVVGFFLPTPVFATEGTCSWHGGVNCNAMADWDGSAICNDGWRDSSEEFYTTATCLIDKHACTQAEFQLLFQQYNISDLETKINSLVEQINQFQLESITEYEKALQSGETLSFAQGEAESVRGKYDLKLSYLRLELENLYSDYRLKKYAAYDACYKLGGQHYYGQQVNSVKQNTLSVISCPLNSYKINSTQCACNNGLVATNGGVVFTSGDWCVPLIDYCKKEYGPNSYVESDACACMPGSTKINNTCQVEKKEVSVSVIQPLPPAQPTPVVSAPPQLPIQPKQVPAPMLKKTSVAPTITPIIQVNPTSTPDDNIIVSAENTKKPDISTPKPAPQKLSIFGSIKKFFLKFKFW